MQWIGGACAQLDALEQSCFSKHFCISFVVLWTGFCSPRLVDCIYIAPFFAILNKSLQYNLKKVHESEKGHTVA